MITGSYHVRMISIFKWVTLSLLLITTRNCHFSIVNNHLVSKGEWIFGTAFMNLFASVFYYQEQKLHLYSSLDNNDAFVCDSRIKQEIINVIVIIGVLLVGIIALLYSTGKLIK